MHVLAPLYAFFTPFGCFGGGGVPRVLGHNLLMEFSNPRSSKMEFSETEFFYILTIHNDQVSYIKHVVDPLYWFFFYRIRVSGGGGGVPRGLGHNLLMQFSNPGSSKMKMSDHPK